MSDFNAKFNFGWGSDPDPAGGAYSAPPDPVAGLRGPASNGRGGEGESRGGEGTRPPFTPPIHISGYAPESTLELQHCLTS